MLKFKVALFESEEGFCIWVPYMRGCISEGKTREEALENIRDAIQLYCEVHMEEAAKNDEGPVTFETVEVEI